MWSPPLPLFQIPSPPLKSPPGILQIGQLRPGDVEVPKMVARLYHRMGQQPQAIEALEQHMKEHPGVYVCRVGEGGQGDEGGGY